MSLDASMVPHHGDTPGLSGVTGNRPTGTRRDFLSMLAVGGLMAQTPLAAPPPALKSATDPERQSDFASFSPIKPSRTDELILPPEFQYKVIALYGEKLPVPDHPTYGAQRFGFNPDFTCYFPMVGKVDEGLLWVNHEYPDPLFVSGYDIHGTAKKTKEQIIAEKLSVGGTVLHIKADAAGDWSLVANSPYTRRITALYPDFVVTGPYSATVQTVVGTLANCSGGHTPWQTVLSGEENFQDYNPRNPQGTKFGYRWSDVKEQAIDELHFGWICEIDPFGKLPPKKHTALGRFAHENVSIVCQPGKPLVLYMGDDIKDGCLYKYESKDNVPEGGTPQRMSKLLEEGRLFAADIVKGRWIELALKGDGGSQDTKLIEAVEKARVAAKTKYLEASQGLSPSDAQTAARQEFSGKPVTQEQVLCFAREAAWALGASKLNRPEDSEVIFDTDGSGRFSLYVSLTNHDERGDFFGSILRLREGTPSTNGAQFSYEIFSAGGTPDGMACPDNLAVEPAANGARIWVTCDMTSSKLGSPLYGRFGNNGMFAIDTTGSAAGKPRQFASGPVECELTGPWFTDDSRILFLSVQHPGEETMNTAKPTSSWPNPKHRLGRDLTTTNQQLPLGGVVAITRAKPQ